MSRNRGDSQKAKLRRDHIRREKHAQRAGPPARDGAPYRGPEHPFAAERALREMQALLEGQHFESIDEANARLAEITSGGRLSQLAGAWKRDDPKWRAQELAYDALETDSLGEALRLVNEALKLDPDCTDAQRLMVSVLPASPENKTSLMREVVEKAERNLGEAFFQEHMGHFWGTMSTRPYMRAKQHLGELLVETGRLTEAAAVFERLLELNPTDNQGMRYSLLTLYLASQQAEKAGHLMSRYPGEEKVLASFAWARVLERWLSGKLDEAAAALARARTVNKFAERYISGMCALPAETPPYFRPGDETEAQVCAREFSLAWERNPAFREWLRAHSNLK
jgi:tetratricopeptide (TPR) repeat protein